MTTSISTLPRLSPRLLGLTVPPLRTSGAPPDIAPKLAAAIDNERQAQRFAVSQHRALLKEAAASSVELMHVAKRHRAVSVRAEWDEQTGKAVTKNLNLELADVSAASVDDVNSLSVILNTALCHLYPEARTQTSFFLLFKEMDHDGSGLVSYHELLRLIRKVLRVSKEKISDHSLQSVWRWLDEDSSGMISAGEFNRLMRQGWTEGFVAEYNRLQQRGLRALPWTRGSSILLPEPPWAAHDRASVHAHRSHEVKLVCKAAAQRTRALHESARHFERQKNAWSTRLERTLSLPSSLSDQHRASTAVTTAGRAGSGLVRPSTSMASLPARKGSGDGGGVGASMSTPHLH